MNENPYQAPALEFAEATVTGGLSVDKCPVCPECGMGMESGYVASSARLYWRNWTNLKWLLRGNESLSKTGSVLSINKLSGFRCVECEVVLFAYGRNRKKFSPKLNSQS